MQVGAVPRCGLRSRVRRFESCRGRPLLTCGNSPPAGQDEAEWLDLPLPSDVGKRQWLTPSVPQTRPSTGLVMAAPQVRVRGAITLKAV